MRPIGYGIILAIFGLLGWFIFSFVAALEQFATGSVSLFWLILITLSFFAMVFSIPAAIIIEIGMYVYNKRKLRHEEIWVYFIDQNKQITSRVPFLLEVRGGIAYYGNRKYKIQTQNGRKYIIVPT